MNHPKIIQGGMGIGASAWQLARAVSLAGQMGVVSGVALDVILVRRLQLGDLDGVMKQAIDKFPIQRIAKRVWNQYYIPSGKPASQPFKTVPLPSMQSGKELIELTVLANFVEVCAAKNGHNGIVGINYLEKIQLPTLPALYGAMLAGVDYVLMGAGIPRAIPGVMDMFSDGQAAELRLDVVGASPDDNFASCFDPSELFGAPAPKLKRPYFLAIISSATLALTLAKKASGKVDGFVVEGSPAGGHNAPPRGQMQIDDKGEPVYGVRDIPDIQKIRDIGLPFWLAGAYGEPQKVCEAISCGAVGVQVGTAFAFCEESSILPEIRQKVIKMARDGQIKVFTDPLASPTGFPFKVVNVDGSVSDETVYEQRERICDLGLLRHYYKKGDGSIGYRCPAEPVDAFIKKGGDTSETDGRKCICNGLVATSGLGQITGDGSSEKSIVTAGDDLVNIARYLSAGKESFTAADVVRYLLSGLPDGASKL